MNATAQFKDGKLEIWCGTQAPGLLELTAAKLLGIETADVTVHTTRMGGGFGRRTEVDCGLYAAAIAVKTEGRPVKVTWTREEDMSHDLYRPRAMGAMKAAIREGEPPLALDFHVASPSILKSIVARTYPSLPMGGPDDTVLDGAFNQPMTYENSRFAAHVVDLPVPVGFWRSVGNSFNAWFHECFLDEVAEASGLDPIEMRLKMMQGETFAPARAVLEKVAEMSNWGGPLPEGNAQGVAFCMSFGTWVAQVVQVAQTDSGIRIEKVWCAADPGTVLDPGNFEAQMMSGIVYGLSQALGEEITFENGEVVQQNFYDFDAMRMWQCPEIEVAILENAPRMGGAGEPGTPPSTPALTNAIYALTGKRIRKMPLSHAVDFA
jgi:isoquinoline 1-oxidoreductase subunit beta